MGIANYPINISITMSIVTSLHYVSLQIFYYIRDPLELFT